MQRLQKRSHGCVLGMIQTKEPVYSSDLLVGACLTDKMWLHGARRGVAQSGNPHLLTTAVVPRSRSVNLWYSLTAWSSVLFSVCKSARSFPLIDSRVSKVSLVQEHPHSDWVCGLKVSLQEWGYCRWLMAHKIYIRMFYIICWWGRCASIHESFGLLGNLNEQTLVLCGNWTVYIVLILLNTLLQCTKNMQLECIWTDSTKSNNSDIPDCEFFCEHVATEWIANVMTWPQESGGTLDNCRTLCAWNFIGTCLYLNEECRFCHFAFKMQLSSLIGNHYFICI